MAEAPAVSVILPTYNRAAIIERAVRSVLAQTFRDLELIVVDDGSSDDTAARMQAIADPRLIYLQQPHSGSAAIARNAGVRVARAELLAFQDSDDEWLVDKLRRQVEALQRAPAHVGLICGGYIILPRSGRSSYMGADARMQRGDWDADNIYDFCFITPTWLIHRSALAAAGAFDEQMPNLEDWELSFRLFRQGTGIIALNQPLVLKHGGADSLNWEPASRIRSLQMIIERHAGMWRQHPQVLARLHDELGRLHCRMGEMAAGRAEFRVALDLDSRSLKRRALLLASYLGRGGYRSLRTIAGGA
ncbi:MAG: glycosyltransferase family 2 protein [Stenotrophobium sp.]